MNSKRFPEGFLWGGATADFQFEGGFGEGGRGINSQDFVTDGSVDRARQITLRMPDGTKGYVNSLDSIPEGAVPEIFDDEYYPSHKAVDFYHHYKEDIALMGELGFKVFRFGVTWSRIYPTGDEEMPNEEEMARGLENLKKHDFKVFGFYRIAIGILVLVLGLTNVISIAL